MTVKRISNPREMSKEHYLKPLPSMTFEEAKRLYGDKPVTVYFYERSVKRGNLLFEQRELIEVKKQEEQLKPAAGKEPAAVVQLALL